MGELRLADLAGRRVAVWGLGEEGRSALRAVRRYAPDAELAGIDDRSPPAAGAALAASLGAEVLIGGAALAALARFDVVVKSPGVSLYRPEIAAARERGVRFTSATRLWFAERPDARAVCVTGSKGKSTTAALLAALLAAAGRRVALAGNIGRPLLDRVGPRPPEDEPELWVIELSSYQTADLAAAPAVAVLLNLYPEHLSWHGSVDRYYRDKLRLFARLAPGAAVVNRRGGDVARFAARFAEATWFNQSGALDARDGAIFDGEERLTAATELALAGRHNLENACGALAAARRLGHEPRALVEPLRAFRGLPHRLYPLGERDGLLWVDDSISTIPQSAVAAIEAFAGRPLTLLAGGHDRGVDPAPLIDRLRAGDVGAVVTLPDSGTELARRLRAARLGPGTVVREAADLAAAVAIARRETPTGGVVLLSPAAASFGRFADYRERGRAFARAAGLEPAPPLDVGAEG